MHSAAQQQSTDLQVSWVTLFPQVAVPPEAQWSLWLLRHGFDNTKEALLQLAERFMKSGGQMTPEHMGKFLSAVANRLTRSNSVKSSVPMDSPEVASAKLAAACRLSYEESPYRHAVELILAKFGPDVTVTDLIAYGKTLQEQQALSTK